MAGKILLGLPTGHSPIKPEVCAPIGLKYLKFIILHLSGLLLIISFKRCSITNLVDP